MAVNWGNAIWGAVGAIGGMGLIPLFINKLGTIPPLLSTPFFGSVSAVTFASSVVGIIVVEWIMGMR